jgi:hypothetical protein
VTNVGSEPTDGSPITITDRLPAGVTFDPTPTTLISPLIMLDDTTGEPRSGYTCDPGPPATCTATSTVLYPGSALNMFVSVNVDPALSGEAVNEVEVTGGGTASASATESTPVNAEPAPFEFQAFDTSVTDEDGALYTQAGGHPYRFHTGFQFSSYPDPAGYQNAPSGTLKDAFATLPSGFVVNPRATAVRCTEAELETKANFGGSCPDAAAVGLVHIVINGLGFANPSLSEPLYNMVPPPGAPAELGFEAAGFGIAVHLIGGVNSSGEYEFTSTTNDILQYAGITGLRLELWGDPTDPSHDRRRGKCGYPSGAFSEESCPTGRLNQALLTMPSNCAGPPFTMTLAADSWENRGAFLTDSSSNQDSDGNPVGVDGCNALEFEPTIKAQPTTNLADSPSGLDFNLHQPQNEDVEGLGTASAKNVTVSLPKGMTLNAAAAGGLDACSRQQIGYQPKEGKVRFSQTPQSCPDAAKIGSLEVNTPLLEEKLSGSVYLAKPYQNPFGSLLALYLAVEDEQTGIIAKLAGKVTPDPQTGQLTTQFEESPQLPLEDVSLHFFKGPRAPLKTPLTCGKYTTSSDLTPWTTPEGADAHPADSFATSVAAAGSGTCPQSEDQAPYRPSFSAGTEAPQAGAYSPFLLKVSRADGTQRLASIDTTLPKGLIGKLAGIPYCSEAAIAQAKSREAPNQGIVEQRNPSCPRSSEVGTLTVGVGAGISPFYATGHAYLAGPYKGAPLSFVFITPAVAGPFDLGSVVSRVAAYVDPESAQIHAVSDPLPSILDGVPLDIRSVSVRLDRPSFTLNPTSCDPMQVLGTLGSTLGQSQSLDNPFQVGGCNALKFGPKLALSLKGGTTRGKHPALKAVVTYPKGNSYANLASAQVTLPHSEFIENSHFKTICTRVQFAQHACPKGSIYGFARATTPLLEKPLSGPVYLRSSSHELPDLVVALSGQVEVVVAGRVDSGKGGGLRNTFEATPDAPVSKFVLEMQGGKKGLLVNSENICRKPQSALVHLTAQDGTVLNSKTLVANNCKKARKGGKGHGSKR